MKILVACEESQALTIELRKLGHLAYSCDLLDCSGGHPEWHIKGDVSEYLNEFFKWDIIFAFPPCTYLSRAGATRMFPNSLLNIDRYNKMLAAREFFMLFYNIAWCNVVIENPIPLKICNLPEPSQIIQPYDFGDIYSKATCLWIKGDLPFLEHTSFSKSHLNYIGGSSYPGVCPNNQKLRSKLLKSIAVAMANQFTAVDYNKQLSLFDMSP